MGCVGCHGGKLHQIFRRVNGSKSGELDKRELEQALYKLHPITGRPMGLQPSLILEPEEAFDVREGACLLPLLLCVGWELNSPSAALPLRVRHGGRCLMPTTVAASTLTSSRSCSSFLGLNYQLNDWSACLPSFATQTTLR